MNIYIVLISIISFFISLFSFDRFVDVFVLNEDNHWIIRNGLQPKLRSTIIVLKIFTDSMFIILTYLTHLKIKKLKISKETKTIKLLLFHIPLLIIFEVYQFNIALVKDRSDILSIVLDELSFFEIVFVYDLLENGIWKLRTASSVGLRYTIAVIKGITDLIFIFLTYLTHLKIEKLKITYESVRN
ncbi:unnamed protein product [Caenorhabditis angaria]|uniref:Uncharacterized protein n=1 Tax=Caenorhabditis angaria TaxID=860376 RepID=A0A9P1IR89_9PELO|nr:unnamed protein product [Caenorhabditis angaria]